MLTQQSLMKTPPTGQNLYSHAVCIYVTLSQLSGGKPVKATPTDPTLSSRLQESKDEVKQLKRKLESLRRENDQANSDLSVLQDSMLQQREESAKEVLIGTALKLIEGKGPETFVGRLPLSQRVLYTLP